MSRPSKGAVYAADATALGDLADPTRQVATGVRDGAEQARRTIYGLEWTGFGKQAAEGRADRELAQNRTVAEAQIQLASTYRDGAAAMQPMIESLVAQGRGLEADFFHVSEDWRVIDTYNYQAGKDALIGHGASEEATSDLMNQIAAARAEEAATATVNLQRLADELGRADQQTSGAINQLAKDLQGSAPLIAGLSGGTTGSDDLKAAMGGIATPPQLARLRTAGALTDAAAAELAAGRPLTLSQQQYDYLRSVMQGLDGVSLKDVATAFSQDAGLRSALNNSIAIMGSTNVQTGNGDRGGVSALPESVRKTLTDPLLRVDGNIFRDLVAAGHHGFDPRNLFSHWDDYQTLGEMMKQVNPAIMNGNAISSALLGKVSETFDLVKSAHWSVEAREMLTGMTEQTQSILAVAGRDGIAAHDLITGSGGEAFLSAALTHSWPDGGAALSALLPATSDHSVMAGETMHAIDSGIGKIAGEHLMEIAGTEKQSLGQTSPEFVKALAEANKPYVDDMFGTNFDGSQGFGRLDSHLMAEAPITRDLFAVIDTNSEAASTLNSNAYMAGMRYQDAFTQSVVDGNDADRGSLAAMAQIRGVVDSAANAAANHAVEHGNALNADTHEIRKKWCEMAINVAKEMPGAKPLFALLSVPMREMLVGDLLQPEPEKYVQTSTATPVQHAIAQLLIDQNIGDPGPFVDKGLVDPETRQLHALTDATANGFKTALAAYFNGIDPNVGDAVDDYMTTYLSSLPKGEIGKK